MKLTVLVPTYRRPAYMARCLHALEPQTRSADQVLVVVRESDVETQELFTHFSFRLPLEVVTVTVPGQVAALNAGLDRVDGEVVAITDDDAAPHHDWLQRIEQHFVATPNLRALVDATIFKMATSIATVRWLAKSSGSGGASAITMRRRIGPLRRCAKRGQHELSHERDRISSVRQPASRRWCASAQ